MDARRYPKRLKNGAQIGKKWSLRGAKMDVETKKKLRKSRPAPRTAPRKGSIGFAMVLGTFSYDSLGFPANPSQSQRIPENPTES